MATKSRKYRVQHDKGEVWDVKATSRDGALRKILGEAEVKVLLENISETKYAWPVGPEGQRWIERYTVLDMEIL